jgi:hypothetical protein
MINSANSVEDVWVNDLQRTIGHTRPPRQSRGHAIVFGFRTITKHNSINSRSCMHVCMHWCCRRRHVSWSLTAEHFISFYPTWVKGGKGVPE